MRPNLHITVFCYASEFTKKWLKRSFRHFNICSRRSIMQRYHFASSKKVPSSWLLTFLKAKIISTLRPSERCQARWWSWPRWLLQYHCTAEIWTSAFAETYVIDFDKTMFLERNIQIKCHFKFWSHASSIYQMSNAEFFVRFRSIFTRSVIGLYEASIYHWRAFDTNIFQQTIPSFILFTWYYPRISDCH